MENESKYIEKRDLETTQASLNNITDMIDDAQQN